MTESAIRNLTIHPSYQRRTVRRALHCKHVILTIASLTRNQKSYELMIRALLDLPSQPAVINMQYATLIEITAEH